MMVCPGDTYIKVKVRTHAELQEGKHCFTFSWRIMLHVRPTGGRGLTHQQH